jgi:hypothetical protein
MSEIPSWLQAAQTVGIVLLALLGLFMNAKFAKFEREHVRPLSEKLLNESRDRAIANTELVGLVKGLDATVGRLDSVASRIDDGVRVQAIELGQHREQIATLFRQKERLESRIDAMEHKTERRGGPR